MTESDYNMTYTFDWAYDDVVAGSDEHKKLEAQHRSAVQMAVHKSIEALRRMDGCRWRVGLRALDSVELAALDRTGQT
jgi:hypothetical protein